MLLPIYGHKCWKKSSKIGRPDWTTSEPAVAVLCQKSYLKCNATKGENASQVVCKIVNGAYGAGYQQQLITCNFGLVDSSSSIFDVKDAPRTGRLVVENVVK
ncbi:hypothetical protein TNCV_989321 [Trichonephila clavipes]|nr:hypothetical protein TNCV_989321 [Trichonephila clavipes]